MRLRERRPELRRALATAVVVAGVTLVPPGLAAAQTDGGDGARSAADTASCTVVFVPPIVAGSDRAVVYADILGEIGRTTEVVPEPGSGLAVRLVLRGEDDLAEPSPPRVFDLKVVLDASEAREGRWGITFDGTDGACPGEIVVRRSSAAARPGDRGDRAKDPGSDL